MAMGSERGTRPGPVVAVGRADVERAVAAGVIGAAQADGLWQFLSGQAAARDAAKRKKTGRSSTRASPARSK